MKKIVIENTKSIRQLEFVIPERKEVYLLVGANGVGKTTLLVCLDRICNPNGFARGFSASHNFGSVDQYRDACIRYEIDNPEATLQFRKKQLDGRYLQRGKVICCLNLDFRQRYLLRQIQIELIYRKLKLELVDLKQ